MTDNPTPRMPRATRAQAVEIARKHGLPVRLTCRDWAYNDQVIAAIQEAAAAAEIAQPAAPEPLTDGQIVALFVELNVASTTADSPTAMFKVIVRAVEAAHGIGATQAQPATHVPAEIVPLTDERCDEIANATYTALRATGWNGGMGGQTWDRALVRAAIATQAPKCEACSGRGEVGGLRIDGYHTEECPRCKGSGLATQAAPAPKDPKDLGASASERA